MKKENFLKTKISAKKPVFGTWNTLACVDLTEAIASSGLDYLFIDFEHGPYDFSRISDYVRACECHACSPVVRVPSLSDWMIAHALDQGAHGVIVPHIETKQAALELVNYTKYYPIGKRGYSPFTKAGKYGANSEKHAERSNDFVTTMIIVESKEGLHNIDEILSVDGIDVVFFGTYDLSQSYGDPGNTKNEELLKDLEPAIQKVIDAGKCPGGFLAQTKEDFEFLKNKGIQLFVYKVDSDLIRGAYAKAYTDFKDIVGEA